MNSNMSKFILIGLNCINDPANIRLGKDVLKTYCNFVLLIGDFNAKSRNWSNHDIATTEGTQLDLFDLVFFHKPNTVLDYGVCLSPHPNCYHQIIYSKT